MTPQSPIDRLRERALQLGGLNVTLDRLVSIGKLPRSVSLALLGLPLEGGGTFEGDPLSLVTLADLPKLSEALSCSPRWLLFGQAAPAPWPLP